MRTAMIAAVENAGFHDLTTMLRAGEWRFGAGEVLVQVPDRPSLVEMTAGKGSDAERVLNQAAARAANRPLRVRLVGTANGGVRPAARPAPSGGVQTRSRIADEPVVRRLQEKFGAEIRSVIDYREKP